MLPIVQGKLARDPKQHESSSQASADPDGQPLPAYTATLLSMLVLPHSESSAVPLNEAVQANQTSLVSAVVP